MANFTKGALLLILLLGGCDFGVNTLGWAVAVPAQAVGVAIGGAAEPVVRGSDGVKCVTLTYTPGPCSVENTRP